MEQVFAVDLAEVVVARAVQVGSHREDMVQGGSRADRLVEDRILALHTALEGMEGQEVHHGHPNQLAEEGRKVEGMEAVRMDDRREV